MLFPLKQPVIRCTRAILSLSADRYPESDRPRLLHGMAWLIDDITPLGTPEIHGDEGQEREDRQLASEWFANSKRALLAPHGVGTVDQVMMSLLMCVTAFLRLFGLSKKVLIIDECTPMTNIWGRSSNGFFGGVERWMSE